MNKETSRKIVIVGVPILCLGIATGLFAHQVARLGRAKADVKSASLQLATLERSAQNVNVNGKKPVMPFVPQSPGEESKFLDHVRSCAQAARVKIVNWTSATRAATELPADSAASPTGGTDTRSAADTEKLLSGLTAIDSDVVVNGSFEGIRKFARELVDSDRLLTIGSAVWTRSQQGSTQLTVRVSRYVGPQVAMDTSARADSGPIGGHEG